MSASLARTACVKGAIACLPLSLAVAPWGLLAGSMAIEANLTPLEGQGFSAIVFAGAAQLVAIDRKSTRLNSSHLKLSRMPSSA